MKAKSKPFRQPPPLVLAPVLAPVPVPIPVLVLVLAPAPFRLRVVRLRVVPEEAVS